MKFPTHFQLFMLLTPAATTAAAANCHNKSSIEWGPCDIDTRGLDVQCGKLTVPLDYTNKTSNKTIDLELIKYPAKKQPAPKGSLLLNFGGPGENGVESLVVYQPLQAPAIGDDFDLISWDPRGTRNTLTFQCWDDPAKNTLTTDWYNASASTPDRLWAEAGEVSELCHSNLGDVGSYVGMAFVARDIMRIVDALGEDGMLRFWGISGGTIMGATVAAMFPERIDKMVLDGVVNSKEYYHSILETEFSTSSDDVFRGFMAGCIATPDACPLAAGHETAADLEVTLDAFLDDVKDNPIDVPDFTVIDYSLVMNYLFSTLYRPSEYQNLSIILKLPHNSPGSSLLEAFYPLTRFYSTCHLYRDKSQTAASQSFGIISTAGSCQSQALYASRTSRCSPLRQQFNFASIAVYLVVS